MSIEPVLLMHFQTAATPLADLSVYDLAHGWVFDLHLGCATCCSWLDAAVFHQRKIHSTLTVAVKTAVRRCAASARARPSADWALAAVSWNERQRARERDGRRDDVAIRTLNKQQEHSLRDCERAILVI